MPSATPGNVEQIKVEFYVQVLTAEAMLSSGKLSSVDTVFTGRSLKRYWNEVVCGTRDLFLNRLMLRGVACCTAAGQWEDPDLRGVIATVLGGLLFGAHTYPLLSEVLHAVLNLGKDLKTMFDIILNLFQNSTPSEAKSMDLTHPVTPHILARLLLIYESIILRTTFRAEGVKFITLQKINEQGVNLHGLLEKSLSSGHDLLTSCCLRVVAAMCIADPVLCKDLFDILSVAAYFETTEVSDLSLSLAWDVTFLHRQLGIGLGTDEDSGLGHLIGFLYEPSITKQRISAFGVARLLLHEPLPNPEYLLSLLASKQSSPVSDPLLKSHLTSFFTAYAPNRQEALANAVVYLAVEAHEKQPIPSTPKPHSIDLLLSFTGAGYLPRLAAAVCQNLTDFFGSSPTIEVVEGWLGDL